MEQVKENLRIESQNLVNLDRQSLLLAAAFMMAAPSLSAQEQQSKENPAAAKKKMIENIRLYNSISGAVETEMQYSGDFAVLAQTWANLTFGAEKGNAFAEVTASPMVFNDNDDKKFDATIAQMLIKAGVKLDGGRLVFSLGKKKLMGDDNSGCLKKTIGGSNRDILDRSITATGDNTINVEWESKNGDKIGLGTIEEAKGGAIFNFNNQTSFYLFARKMLFDNKLKLSGVAEADQNGNLTGYAAIRYTPNQEWSLMAEGTKLGEKDRAAILTLNKSIKTATAALGAYFQENQAGATISVHFDKSYVGVGYNKAKGEKGTLVLSAGLKLNKAYKR